MCRSVGSSSSQLHPLQVEIKRGWEKLIINKGIKQDFLAIKCGVDKSQISHWKNPESTEFPSWPRLTQLVEAMQEWPGVMRHEPLEEMNRYFGCRASDINYNSEISIDALMSLFAGSSGKALQAFLQATSPDSPGGRNLTKEERVELQPIVHYLRHLAEALDDAVNGGAQ